MKIFVTGGTGFVGTTLAGELTEKGHKVTLLTRSIKKDATLPEGASFLQGDPREKGAWQKQVPLHEVIINLAGASIFTRWTKETKKLIRESRVLTTQNLVESLAASERKTALFLSTSAVGYYGFRGDEALDEESPPGKDFLASICQEWEAEALGAQDLGLRVVICRFGIVMGRKGGALGQLLPLFQKGLGSPLGHGSQWISWIHEQDLVRIYGFVLDRKDISGPLNCTAPHPVRNKEMTKFLGQVLHRPTFLPPVPGFVLKLKMGEFATTLLNGQKVIPKRLLDMGFEFTSPDLSGALKDLLSGARQP